MAANYIFVSSASLDISISLSRTFLTFSKAFSAFLLPSVARSIDVNFKLKRRVIGNFNIPPCKFADALTNRVAVQHIFIDAETSLRNCVSMTGECQLR